MALKKIASKWGMFKDAIKGLETLGIGILLIILGFATLAILPLAIICFIAGGSMTFTGLGLIIHNKRNNSFLVYPENRPSSKSTSALKTSNDRVNEFKSRIENYSSRISVSYTLGNNGKIILTAYIDCSAWTGAGEAADAREGVKIYNSISTEAVNIYRKVAKNCPFGSEIKCYRE